MPDDVHGRSFTTRPDEPRVEPTQGTTALSSAPADDLAVVIEEDRLEPAPPSHPALERWRLSLAAAQLPDTLVEPVEPDQSSKPPDVPHTLDLTHAHPSGLATLLAGRPTRLSSLVREPAAHALARHRARAIRARANELATSRGVRASYLSAGLVTWLPSGSAGLNGSSGPDGSGGLRLKAPLLLRGCTLRPRGAGHDDYDLDLDDTAQLNPELVRRLAHDGIALDGDALGALAFGVEGFDPRPVYARIEELCAELPGLRIEARLVVGTFTSGSAALLADLDGAQNALRTHPVLSQLLEDDVQRPGDDVQRPEDDGSGVPDRPDDDRPLVLADPPADPVLSVFDLDPAQRAAVDAAMSGAHVAVEGPPGTGLTQTLAATIAAMVAAGRRVLVVTPHRASVDALVARLDSAGLRDVVLDLHDGAGNRPRVLATLATSLQASLEAAQQGASEAGAAGASTQAAAGDAGAVGVAAFDQARDALAGAGQALHAVREPWGVSAYDAMVALADLMSSDTAPRTRVRLPAEVCDRLDAQTRQRLRADLHEAAALGSFSLTRVDTRWLDAQVRSEHEAQHALDAACAALHGLATARETMQTVAEAAGLAPAATVAEWRPQLEVLVGVRETLDQLLPAVYEQPIADLIAAVSAQGGPPQAGRLARRGLRQRAKALVRPGVQVKDLAALLIRAQRQRVRWQELSQGGGWPRVPTGLSDAGAAVAAIEAAFGVLAGYLEGTGTPDLYALPLDKAQQRLADLVADQDSVRALPRRTVLLDRLRAAGLGELLADLRQRRALADDIEGELDLAWWTSVLEATIRADDRLARHDPAGLLVVANDLRMAENRLAAAGTGQVLAAVAARGRAAVEEFEEQTQWLRAEVHRGHRSRWPNDLVRRAGDLVGALRPVWIMSSETVARALPQAGAVHRLVDVVVVDDAGQVGLPETAAALSRGAQLVIAGDRRGLPPATGGPSVMDGVAGVIGVHRLDRDHRTRDGRLLIPLRSYYPQCWALTPGATAQSPLELDQVPDAATVAPEDLALGNTDAEVERVVELVTEHAIRRPGESLLVVTLGARHAERIESALRAAVPSRPILAQWLDVHWTGEITEPFLVRPVHRLVGLERDAVIVSIGLPRTAHGRVLHRFGVLDGRFGQACLVAALSRARRRTMLVCSFAPTDLAPERLRTEGAQMLRDILQVVADPQLRGDHPELVARRSQQPAGDAPVVDAPVVDALVSDLRDRLDAVGLPVRVGFPAPDWPLDLAVSDEAVPGRMVLAVDIDGRSHASCPSVRVRDRQRREAFERAGWTYLRICAMDLFCDPAGQLERIRDAWRAAGGSLLADAPATTVIFGRPKPRLPWPGLLRGRPMTEYRDDDLDAVAVWVSSDGVSRSVELVAVQIREALHLGVQGPKVEARLIDAACRAMKRTSLRGRTLDA